MTRVLALLFYSFLINLPDEFIFIMLFLQCTITFATFCAFPYYKLQQSLNGMVKYKIVIHISKFILSLLKSSKETRINSSVIKRFPYDRNKFSTNNKSIVSYIFYHTRTRTSYKQNSIFYTIPKSNQHQKDQLKILIRNMHKKFIWVFVEILELSFFFL